MGFFENSNSKFEVSELKLVPEEIDKARHTARYIRAPVALDTNDLANFNTEQSQLVNSEAVTEEENF